MVKRQTTFWDLLGPSKETRIHFIEKQEFAYVEESFVSWRVLEQHPLLIDYEYPWLKIFIRGKSDATISLEAELRDAVAKYSPRPSGVYFNELGLDHILESGDGLIFDGPEPIAKNVMSILSKYELNNRSFPSREPMGPMKLLEAGNSYVIARDFRYE